MQLTLFTDYSLRMLIYLGVRRGEHVPIQEIAAAYGVSKHYMQKVANELTRLGYLDAMRGRKGGVQLALTPKKIRLGELIRRTEPERGVLASDRSGSTPPVHALSGLEALLAEAEGAFFKVLDRHTLADMVERPDELSPVLGLDGIDT